MLAAESWRLLHERGKDRLDSWTGTVLDRFADWEKTAAGLCVGDTLVHTSVTATDLMLTARAVTILDWGQAHIGPAWTDLATFAAALIEHGHTPPQAEKIVGQSSVWQSADPAAITAYAVLGYGRWEWLRYLEPHPVHEARASAWRRWARHRWTHFPPTLSSRG
jgi:aminoglycoside phosphotransferase (APT) family kinase protein